MQKTVKQQLLSLSSCCYTTDPPLLVPCFPDRKQDHKQRINVDAISCYFEMEVIHSWLRLCHTAVFA